MTACVCLMDGPVRFGEGIADAHNYILCVHFVSWASSYKHGEDRSPSVRVEVSDCAQTGTDAMMTKADIPYARVLCSQTVGIHSGWEAHVSVPAVYLKRSPNKGGSMPLVAHCLSRWELLQLLTEQVLLFCHTPCRNSGGELRPWHCRTQA
jgi:hypothetical protein